MLLSGSIYAFSQEVCACCTESYLQFDFWVGKWEVKDTNDILVGRNHIIKKEDGCIIAESWTGAGTSSGSSYNYFDKSDSTWNQLWIDNNGGNLKLKGKATGNKMTLKSDLIQGKEGSYYHQIEWTNNADSTVTQQWNIYTEFDQFISTAFLGIYKRRNEK